MSHLRQFLSRQIAIALSLLLMGSASALPEAIPGTYRQGSLHGFLLLKSANGRLIATGDQTNVVHGEEIHAELILRFRDGSIDDEVTDYRQGTVFQLIRDHHIQKGPSFPKPLDMTISVPDGAVTWMEWKDGKSETKTQHMDLPPDLINGMMQLAVEDFPPRADELKTSYLAADPKPRVVTLSIKPDGNGRVRIGGMPHEANRFNIHVEIGGLAGVVAPLVGKQPVDSKAWAIGGDAPLLIGMQAAFYPQGPIWTLMLTSPTWPSTSKRR